MTASLAAAGIASEWSRCFSECSGRSPTEGQKDSRPIGLRGIHCPTMHTPSRMTDFGPMKAPYNRPPQLGDLWRDVVNFVGDAEITPATYLPLLEAVLPKWHDWSYFLGWAAKHLTDQDDRGEIERGLRWARLGYRLWLDERDAIAAVAKLARDRREDDVDLEDWWIGDHPLNPGDERQTAALLKHIRLTDDERAMVEEVLVKNSGWSRILVPQLHRNLRWIRHLHSLRKLAIKTWPADERLRQEWTEDELDWLNWFYQEQDPGLIGRGQGGLYHPFALEVSNVESNLGVGMGGLDYAFYVLMRSTVIDFADDLLRTTTLPEAKGSLRCVECGYFVGRRALGYGQMYCGDTCKKRAAKRRYRDRLATQPVRPQYELGTRARLIEPTLTRPSDRQA